VLKGCLKNIPKNDNKSNDLEAFRAIVSSLVGDIEKMVNETWAVWELEPDSKELRERFHLLERCLSYIRRFCEGRIKGKYQK
jgi:hypothetical protein